MSADLLQGLSCPRCGGMVPVPEGQALVICPYCEQRSAVSAEKLPTAEETADGGETAGGGGR